MPGLHVSHGTETSSGLPGEAGASLQLGTGAAVLFPGLGVLQAHGS